MVEVLLGQFKIVRIGGKDGIYKITEKEGRHHCFASLSRLIDYIRRDITKVDEINQ